MRPDLYAKILLTVIAGCLVYLCLGRPAIVTTAKAQNQPTHVVIVGWANDASGSRVRQLSTEALPVRVEPSR